MTFGVYSVRDAKSGYIQPTFEINDAVAMRNFEHAAENSDSLLFSHFEDFDLYKIGYFDTDTGSITDLIPHQFICNGASALGVKVRLETKE